MLKKKMSLGAVIVIVLLAVLLTFQITFLAVSNKFTQKYNEFAQVADTYDKLTEVDSIFRKYYIGDIDEDALADMILKGYVAGSGDKYAQYMTTDEFTDYMNEMSGNLVGIGITAIYNSDYSALEVLNVQPDSPALDAGVEPGDLIISVEGIDVSELGYYNAIAKMRGDIGTAAEFTVARQDGHAFKQIPFTVVRAQISDTSVMYHLHENGTTGIIKIVQFNETTPYQFKEGVTALIGQGATEFVFDVRYNPGGELESILSILDFLLPEGPMIRIVDREGGETVRESDANELDMPMAVLVNGNTASAAELFSSALRDYDKAVLVGTRTYGKGTMQTILRLSDNSAISVSYRMYNPPFSDNYEGIGLEPDIAVELDEALLNKNIYKITDAEDNQLCAAIDYLHSPAF